MAFCLSIHNVDLAEYEPTMKWEGSPPTEKQADFLMAQGIDPASVSCRGQASAIIDVIIQRRKLNLATPKQVKYLRQLGHIEPETATFKEASEYLSKRWGGKK